MKILQETITIKYDNVRESWKHQKEILSNGWEVKITGVIRITYQKKNKDIQ